MNEPTVPVRGTALLTKALDIVELISDSDNRLKFKDIAERTGHSKSTLYRILSALSARGMIDIDQRDQSYVLGPKFTEMAGSINSSSDLIAVSAGPLKALADQHGESVNLSILLGTAQVTISRWQGRLAQPFHAPLGERKPLYATGLGKCLLAFLPEQEREALMPRIRLAAYTDKTITDLDRLRSDGEITRARGFAVDDNEIIDGIVCVSTPILSADGTPLAAVSITGPAHRMTENRRLELASVLRMTTQRIGQLLVPKYNPHPSALPLPAGGRLDIVNTRAFSSRALGQSTAWGGVLWQDGPAGRLHVERDGETETLVDTGRIDGSALCPAGNILYLSDGTLFRLSAKTRQVEPLLAAAEFDQARALVSLSQARVLVLREGALLSVPLDGAGALPLISGLDDTAGLSLAPGASTMVAVRAEDNQLLQLDLSADGDALLGIEALDIRSASRITGLCLDRSGQIWVAYHQSWSLCLYDLAKGKAQHVAVPIPSLQGLAPGNAAQSVIAGSDRYTLSQSLIEAAPAAGGLVRIAL